MYSLLLIILLLQIYKCFNILNFFLIGDLVVNNIILLKLKSINIESPGNH